MVLDVLVEVETSVAVQVTMVLCVTRQLCNFTFVVIHICGTRQLRYSPFVEIHIFGTPQFLMM